MNEQTKERINTRTNEWMNPFCRLWWSVSILHSINSIFAIEAIGKAKNIIVYLKYL